MSRRKKDDDEIIGGSSTSLDLIISSYERRGRHRVVYQPDDFDKFEERTHRYLLAVRDINYEEEGKGILRLSVEGWAGYMGLTREEIYQMEQNRGEPWHSFIKYVKGLIAAHKIAGAEQGVIPPVVMMFDLVNNYGYVNTNIIKQAPTARVEDRVVAATALPRLDVGPVLPDNSGGDDDGDEI